MLEKLKKIIDRNVCGKIDKKLLEQHKFLPINEQAGTIFIACVDKSDTQIPSIIKANFQSVPKLIQLPSEQFSELLNYALLPVCIPITAGAVQNINANKTLTPNVQPSAQKPKKRIGDILIEKGYVTKEQVDKAFTDSQKRSEPIGSTLVNLGFVTIKQLKDALSEQQGIESVDEKQLKFSDDLFKLFPREFLQDNKVVPISSDGRNVVVGMVNPTDKKVLNEVVFLSGLKPIPRLITFYEFERTVNAFLKEADRKAKLFEHISSENSMLQEETLFSQVEKAIKDDESSISRFANQIITDAIDTKSSDVHIEPRFNGYIVRYRTDGILKKVVEIPQAVESSIISRFKVLARMNIAEHRRAQDGAFSIKHKTKTYDCRINTIPIGGKEKMVIRILQPSISLSAGENRDVELIGAYKEDIEKLKWMTKIPHGIILASGPTGSGKTTTLYSVLSSLNKEDVNITTIEDPVEIRLEGVNQIQVNPKADITFASCLRAILRQDPDIILVGEIRDYETLESAIAAALTGHLVLSTIHTNSAAATISRLMQMGAPNYLIASSLSGIIAQRLVRKLCPHCKKSYSPQKEEVKQILLNEEDIENFTKKTVYQPAGCPQCQFTGYLGRLGLFELLSVNKEIKKLINMSASDIEIEETAISCGMKTLQQYCIQHIINGETPISEFVRVLGVVND
ncbi:MAG: ATPase, T2SS/T4P/T4SS family [Candidatus Gastranaerophilales bacterium]|nr:ATPase, T2SS/T4P/T4SS family [Candidatus Gastranaerophilales bacterium]